MTEAPRGSDESELALAIADYLELQRAGRAPPTKEYAERHPAVAEALASCLEVLSALAPAVDEPEVPRILGDFRIVGLIGRGGMGLVYEAEQRSLPRRVALKVLPYGGALDEERQLRFRREVEAMAQLQHPNIVPVFETGSAGDLPYYTMPLLRGRSLDRVLAALRSDPSAAPLASRAELVRWVERFIDVTRALETAHRAGVLHRDVKPSNLFLEDGGRLLVLDFGLTRSASQAGVTLTGQPVGTPRYMSPEQILAGEVPVDGRSDVFSLGATLYELLTLRPAFPGEDRESIFRQILSEDPLPPRRCDPRVPRDLEVVLLAALEKEPAQRYASAGELADDLRRFLDHEPVRARPTGWLGRLRRRARRSPALAAAIALGVLGLLALLATPVALAVQEARAVARLVDSAVAARVRLGELSGAIVEAERALRAARRSARPWAPLASKREVLDLEREVLGLRRARDAAFREVVSSCLTALDLAPGNAAARRELAGSAFEEYRDAEARRDADRMASLAPFVETYGGEELARAWEGSGSVVVASDPPGAEVFLFAYVERDLRRLPVPWCGGGPDLGALDALSTRGPWRFLRLRDVDAAAGADLRAGDEIAFVCGSPPRDAADVRRHVAEDHVHSLEMWRHGELVRAEVGPRSELAIDGEVIEVEACPLRGDERSSLGPTPTAPLQLPMGSYLALLRCPGRAEVRYPFEIRRLEDERIAVALPAEGDIREGFVWIPEGPAVLGGDLAAPEGFELAEPTLPGFAMQRHETTFAQYREFLRDLEARDPAEARSRAPREGIAGGPQRPLWRTDAAGRIELQPPEGDFEIPILGVSWEDAKAYCRWLNETDGDPAVEFDLPREAEWEKAARGADGRPFVWGDAFEWTFARTGLSAYLVSPVAVGSYPTDESPFGIRDLNGNVREWCADGQAPFERILRGANWGIRSEIDCRLASRANSRPLSWVDTGSGFRVVQRPRRRE